MVRTEHSLQFANRGVPRKGLSASEAALFVGIGETMFRAMVADGRMPRPRMIGTRRIWDVDELSVAFNALPYEGEAEEVDTWADVVLGS